MNYSSPVSSSRPADLSIVIPTYNERDRLAELVDALYSAAAEAFLLEVVIAPVVLTRTAPPAFAPVA